MECCFAVDCTCNFLIDQSVCWIFGGNGEISLLPPTSGLLVVGYKMSQAIVKETLQTLFCVWSPGVACRPHVKKIAPSFIARFCFYES